MGTKTKIFYVLRMLICLNFTKEELNNLIVDFTEYLKADAVKKSQVRRILKIKVEN